MTASPPIRVVVEPLTPEGFALYGDVIDARGTPDKWINAGRCARYHDLARLDIDSENARLGISLFASEPVALPHHLEMVERHPLGSQSFVPMSTAPFLVVVAGDDAGQPTRPRAFLTAPGQGISYLRGTWHGVLTPLGQPAQFAVIDRIGEDANLEEHWFDQPYLVEMAN